MKTLVIEDDAKTAQAIRKGLSGEGYDAAVAKAGADGEREIGRGDEAGREVEDAAGVARRVRRRW